MLNDAIKQIGELPNWVQLWMRWLNIVFLLGLIFVGNHIEARWALVVYVASFPLGFLTFYFVRDIRATGLPHIAFWAPLLGYLVHAAAADPGFRWFSLYAVWLVLLGATICVAVILDLKGLGDMILERLNA